MWLPDRPGAFGSVASRIGAVRGDLVAIDILERGAGRAVDELVIELPDADLEHLLVKELHEVDGVDVEEVRRVPDGRRDRRLAALETAADVVAQQAPAAVLEVLVARACREFEAAWAVVADVERGAVIATGGEAPPAAWVLAFARGVTPTAATGDVAWAPLPGAGLALVLGRPARPLRALEREQLAVLATIADTRWVELARRGSLSAHPTAAV